ncbi:hypothetical protein SGFS_033750 [Streptomyces graminofaciens]|uniref:Uncharacterized protein n=1 Tax=Streptomyces graminofaciens TaxID=68212 RepID=A0ABN5VFU0_9ACTN|nr:hypothetical protein SGFS_033750 [Streptomyces graminofaciens]
MKVSTMPSTKCVTLSDRDAAPGDLASRSVSPELRDSGSAQVSATVRAAAPPQPGHITATGPSAFCVDMRIR